VSFACQSLNNTLQFPSISPTLPLQVPLLLPRTFSLDDSSNFPVPLPLYTFFILYSTARTLTVPLYTFYILNISYLRTNTPTFQNPSFVVLILSSCIDSFQLRTCSDPLFLAFFPPPPERETVFSRLESTLMPSQSTGLLPMLIPPSLPTGPTWLPPTRSSAIGRNPLTPLATASRQTTSSSR